MQSLATSIKRGQAAQWVVSAWVRNGNIPGASLRLQAAPAGRTPEFSFGCGSQNGTASCNLGTVYSGSAQRQVIARISVPANATSVTSVKLTAIGNAPNLVKKPSVSVSVAVGSNSSTASRSSSTSPAGGTGGTGGTVVGNGSTVSQLPVGPLPTIGSGGGATSSLSPGGNASGLFPTINPSNPSGVPGSGTTGDGVARPVANTEALPIGTPVMDAQFVGLAALGVAFLLAVTRLSVRRRPAAAAAGPGATPTAVAAAAPPAAATPAHADKAATAEPPASPDAASPDVASPEAAPLDATMADAPAPDATLADMPALDATLADVQVPDVTLADIARPDVASPQPLDAEGPSGLAEPPVPADPANSGEPIVSDEPPTLSQPPISETDDPAN